MTTIKQIANSLKFLEETGGLAALREIDFAIPAKLPGGFAAHVDEINNMLAETACKLEPLASMFDNVDSKFREMAESAIQFKSIVSDSTSFANVISQMGMKQGGGTQRRVKELAELAGADTSHFLGQASNQGKDKKGGTPRRPHSEVLVDGGREERAVVLRRALIESGRTYECEGKRQDGTKCGLAGEWLGQVLVLQVHHDNGKRTDNRSENLKFLCPNCHSVTENWGKNLGLTEVTTDKAISREYRKRKRNEPKGS